MPSGLFYLLLWTSLFPTGGVSGYVLILPCLVEIRVFNANRVDPDQMPHSAASDLDLHCLQMPLLRYARHKWVKFLC